MTTRGLSPSSRRRRTRRPRAGSRRSIMYLSFYGLREAPFAPTPDPKFLFQSPRHREALAQLIYGVRERKGFIVLTGEIGTGKTTLLRTLLERVDATTP